MDWIDFWAYSKGGCENRPYFLRSTVIADRLICDTLPSLHRTDVPIAQEKDKRHLGQYQDSLFQLPRSLIILSEQEVILFCVFSALYAFIL